MLGDGGDVAVVTDAGTPGISDPGERLVRAVARRRLRGDGRARTGGVVDRARRRAGCRRPVRVRGLPAAVGPGPARAARRARRPSGARSCSTRRRTASSARSPTSPRRCGADRQVAVARELTKLYETVVRGDARRRSTSASRAASTCSSSAGAPPTRSPSTTTTIRAALRAELAAGATRRDAAARVAGGSACPTRGVRPRGRRAPTRRAVDRATTERPAPAAEIRTSARSPT